MNDNIIFSFTAPDDEWLLGIEFVPEIHLEFESDSEYSGSIFSIGLFFFRIDFLIN